MKPLTATAFEHANVAGKKLQYIRITNGKEEVIINVGMKTFEGVMNLEKDEEILPLRTDEEREADNKQKQELEARGINTTSNRTRK